MNNDNLDEIYNSEIYKLYKKKAEGTITDDEKKLLDELIKNTGERSDIIYMLLFEMYQREKNSKN